MIASFTTSIQDRVAALDLDVIVERLVGRYGWTDDRARVAETQYREFLTAAADGRTMSPDPEVDEFWHQHILDTRKYHDDCLAVFGRMLHHQPQSPSATTFCLDSLCVIPPSVADEAGAPPRTS